MNELDELESAFDKLRITLSALREVSPSLAEVLIADLFNMNTAIININNKYR